MDLAATLYIFLALIGSFSYFLYFPSNSCPLFDYYFFISSSV
ncbi:hypothetical protein D1AOALGA4SA_6673 [Olavius algarvensis Delta 1 endosymbiont]|nr:hypothetical protein D1AOALGA4SA_6673 [Olavius algarvensis Delta 1 endosymbiont]